MNPKEWVTIPVLPCVSLEETVIFWETLGFERTYFQKSPYPYAVVQRGGYDLHFIRQKGLKPEEAAHGCLIMVSEVEQVHKDFSQRLRAQMGKVPASGFPRMSRMRPGQTRFTVTDPSGNWVIFIKFGEEDAESWSEPDQAGLTRLQKAIANAVRFRDFKEDPDAAAKVLDVALKHTENEDKLDIAQALFIRAELAVDAEDTPLAENCYAELKMLRLSGDDIETLRQKVRAAEPIGHLFAESDGG